MKRLLEDYGFSILTIISGLIVIALFSILIENNNICNKVFDEYNGGYNLITYEKEYIKSIDAKDVVLNNRSEINMVINNIKAYSNLAEISKDNIYFYAKDKEDNVISLNIIVKYNGDFMSKTIYCYINEENVNEDII